MEEIKPQKGPQEQALRSSADITLLGGEVFGGKTYALLLEPLYHIDNPAFGAVFFRRTHPQIANEGGAWDTACNLYARFGCRFIESKPPQVKFSSGARVTFNHLQHQSDAYAWDGAQIPLTLWDELPTFTERQFWQIQTRMRSDCGVRPYTRATCNPVPESDPVGGWVHRIVKSWWVGEDGFAIPSRSGDVRWFYRVHDELRWFATRQAAIDAHRDLHAKGILPRSFQFIHASMKDNPIGMDRNPDYLSSVQSASYVDRERKLGNWNITETAGNLFKAGWLTEYLNEIPTGGDVTRAIRFWDEASSAKKGADWTVGVLMLVRGAQRIIADVRRGQWTPEKRLQEQKAAAEFDRNLFGRGRCELVIEREGGSSGLTAAFSTGDRLAAYAPRFRQPDTNKITRAKPLSAAWEGGRVVLVRSSVWNAAYIAEHENFPTTGWHDDQVDASSGAFRESLFGGQTTTQAPVGMRAR